MLRVVAVRFLSKPTSDNQTDWNVQMFTSSSCKVHLLHRTACLPPSIGYQCLWSFLPFMPPIRFSHIPFVVTHTSRAKYLIWQLKLILNRSKCIAEKALLTTYLLVILTQVLIQLVILNMLTFPVLTEKYSPQTKAKYNVSELFKEFNHCFCYS